MGELPRYKPKPKSVESNVVVHSVSSLAVQYYYDPRSGHRFRWKKEVYNFTQMGEVPRYKLKPKSEESNFVVHSVVVLRFLCWFSSGGGSNQQPIPSNIEGLGTIFNLEKKAARRTHQAEKETEEK